MNWEPLDHDSLKWLLVDFDFTICKNSGYPDFIPTEPIEGAKEALKKLDAEGWKITIFTSRHWSDYHNIENWLIDQDIPFRRIICGKPLGRWMIDDRNLEFDGNWKRTLRRLKQKERGV